MESLAGVGVEARVVVIEGWKTPLAYLIGAVRLRREIRSSPCDLIHAHYGMSGWVALTQRDLPVVVSFLGSDLLGGHRAGGGPLRRRIESRINQGLAPRFAAVIVKSEGMRQRIPGGEAFVVPNGVDLELFRPLDREDCLRRLGLAPGVPRILFAADPANPVKRFELARRSVALLSQRRPCELHPVFGRPQEELVRWMNACDALLLTSRSEGSPNVVKEALACNLPVVSVPVGDVPSLLADRPGNRVVEGSAAAGTGAGTSAGSRAETGAGTEAATEELARRLADAVQEVLDRGRTRSRESMADLSLEAVARRIRSIYDDVLSTDRRSPAGTA